MIADIIVVLVVAFFIYSGYRSGLMKSFIKIASYIISVVVSFFLYPVLSESLMKTSLYQKLVEIIGEKYLSSGAPQVSKEGILGVFAKYMESGIESAMGTMAEVVATLLVNLISFIIILILSKIIIRITGNILGIFTKLPVIKQFNRLGGSVMGGIVGVFVLYLAGAIIILFAPFSSETEVSKEIDNSVFASEIYNNNLILNFVGKGK